MAEKYVALDVGTTSLKGLEISVSSAGVPTIVRAAMVPLEAQVVTNSKINDQPSLVKALKRLWREGRFSTKLVRFFATGSDVVENRLVTAVPMQANEDSFRKILPFLVKEQVHFEVEDYYIAPYVLSEYMAPDETGFDESLHRDVIVVAVERKFLDTLAQTIRTAGYYPISTDTLSFALLRASYNVMGRDPERTIAAVEMGAGETTIVVHRGGQPGYAHSAVIGGGQVTDSISTALSIGYQEAEFLKVLLGADEETRRVSVRRIVQQGGVPRQLSWNSFGEDDRQTARAIVSQQVGNLIAHVDDQLDAAATQMDSDIDMIILSGGGARLSTFAQRLSSELSIPVEIAQPFAHLKTNKLKPDVIAEQDLFDGVSGLVMRTDA